MINDLKKDLINSVKYGDLKIYNDLLVKLLSKLKKNIPTDKLNENYIIMFSYIEDYWFSFKDKIDDNLKSEIESNLLELKKIIKVMLKDSNILENKEKFKNIKKQFLLDVYNAEDEDEDENNENIEQSHLPNVGFVKNIKEDG